MKKNNKDISIEFEILDVKENKDGSATLTMSMSAELQRLLIEKGFVKILMDNLEGGK